MIATCSISIAFILIVMVLYFLHLLLPIVVLPCVFILFVFWLIGLVKTSIELYTIWEMTGVLSQLETIDENLFDVITDIMDEKREDYQDWLDEQADGKDDD